MEETTLKTEIGGEDGRTDEPLKKCWYFLHHWILKPPRPSAKRPKGHRNCTSGEGVRAGGDEE